MLRLLTRNSSSDTCQSRYVCIRIDMSIYNHNYVYLSIFTCLTQYKRTFWMFYSRQDGTPSKAVRRAHAQYKMRVRRYIQLRHAYYNTWTMTERAILPPSLSILQSFRSISLSNKRCSMEPCLAFARTREDAISLPSRAARA